ncbi:MAG TPA: hypothetical protein VFI27_08725 [candidate division Zixibacteria bacterium]|nr:hypothetical protein [candidate division Zixibacteria bacterium]
MNRRAKIPQPTRVELLLFISIFLTSTFFSEIAYQTSNYTARIFLTEAIVDGRTFRLDEYSEVLGVDGALFDGHLYSNKPPGSSLMMLPQYILIAKPFKALFNAANIELDVQNQDYQIEDVFSGWLVQVFSLALYTSIAFVALYRIFGQVGVKKRRFPLVLLSYFGTLMFAYATIGTGEMYTVPPILLGTYYLLKTKSGIAQDDGEKTTSHRSFLQTLRKNYLIAGFWFGLAFLTTNQIALIILIALVAVLWQEKDWKAPLMFLMPIAAAGLVTLAYNWLSFGNPFSFPIRFWTQGTPEVILFEIPTIWKVAEMLFFPWKGLFFYSPYLIFSVPGFWHLYQASRAKDVESPISVQMVFFLSATPLLFFLFLLFNVGWFGGADYGFRYVIPVLPFLCIGSAIWLSERKLTIPLIVLIGWSVAVCSLGALTDPEVPTGIRNPMLSYNIPLLSSEGTNNLVNSFVDQLLGFDSWLFSFSTTLLFMALMFVIIWHYRSDWRDT